MEKLLANLDSENKTKENFIKEETVSVLHPNQADTFCSLSTSNNNSVPFPRKTLPKSSSKPCASVASSTSTNPARAQPCSTPPESPRSPFPPGPCSPRTPPGFPTSTARSQDASINNTDSFDDNNPKPIPTIQAKLKEVRDGGKKLDYESLVELLKKHPWEETNDTEYDDLDNDTYTDNYEDTSINEEDDELVVNN